MPAVHQRHHNAKLCIGGQVVEIGAVLAVLRHIGIARAKVNARLHTEYLMRSAAVGHQVLALGISCVDCVDGSAAIAVVHKERVRGLTVIVLAV